MTSERRQFWRYARGLAAPVLLWALFAIALVEPLQSWLRGYDAYDEATWREWIQQTGISRETVSDRPRAYLADLDKARRVDRRFDPTHDPQQVLKAEKIQEHLRAMGEPTKMYAGQLPGFPVIYRLEL